MVKKVFYLIVRLPIKLVILSIFLPFFIFVLQQDFTAFINQEKEKTEYSQKLIDLTEKRAYWAENYYRNFKYEADFEERKDRLWQSYSDTTSEYNYNLVPSLIIVKKNFGDDVQNFYHNEVFARLRTIHIEIAKIRTGDSYNEEVLLNNIEELRNRKYRFAETLLNCDATNFNETWRRFMDRQMNKTYCYIY